MQQPQPEAAAAALQQHHDTQPRCEQTLHAVQAPMQAAALLHLHPANSPVLHQSAVQAQLSSVQPAYSCSSHAAMTAVEYCTRVPSC